MEDSSDSLKNLTKKDQLKESLRRQIVGSMRPGERITPELELAERFGLARGTVRRAIQELVDDGLLQARHGIGTFVAGREKEVFPVALIHEVSWKISGHAFYFPFFNSLGGLANQDGYDFQIYHADTPVEGSRKASSHDMPPWRECGNPSLAARMEDMRLSGVIYMLAPYRNLVEIIEGAGLPYVYMSKTKGMSHCVEVDRVSGHRQALDYLASKGCKRVCVANLADDATRDKAVMSHAARIGVETRFHSGLKWSHGWRCDGLFISDDYLALDRIEKIIEFGDYERVVVSRNEGSSFPLPVVPMEVPVGELAAACWRMLLARMRGEASGSQTVLVEPRLIPRTKRQ